jgi:hypothetical protein
MRLRRSAPDISGMSPAAAVAPRPTELSAVRAYRGEDAAELQRRLEAFLLIARRVSPEVRRTAA